ncbi:MAG: DUF4956 domain-containing protein [Limisphaerales bacterium]
MNWLFSGDYGLVPTNYTLLAIGLLLSFAGGQAVAWTYMWTHSGLSYSRAYVNTLIVMPVLVCLVMMVLANNLIIAFGLMAIFALVRFRTVLRDTLDTAYVLAAIVIGLAAGTMKFTTAVVACVATVALMLYFWATNSGARQRHDLVLNLQWLRPAAEVRALDPLFQRHCRSVVCASQRVEEGGARLALSYRVRLRDPARSAEFIAELQQLEGVARVASLAAQDESEL